MLPILQKDELDFELDLKLISWFPELKKTDPEAAQLSYFLLTFFFPLVLSLNLLAGLVCVFLSVLLNSVALFPRFFTLCFGKISSNLFFSMSLHHYFLCNTLQLFENTVSISSSSFWLSSSLLVHSHLKRLSSLFLFLSVFLTLSLFGCSDFLIFLSIYSYVLVPTRCSGVYP